MNLGQLYEVLHCFTNLLICRDKEKKKKERDILEENFLTRLLIWGDVARVQFTQVHMCPDPLFDCAIKPTRVF